MLYTLEVKGPHGGRLWLVTGSQESDMFNAGFRAPVDETDTDVTSARPVDVGTFENVASRCNNLPRIDSFWGEFRYLSNFFVAPFQMHSKVWQTVEHLYQAEKTLDGEQRENIRLADSPGHAKRAGQKAKLRDDWEQVKRSVMMRAVTEKFRQNPELLKRLVGTGDTFLEEGNSWGDTVWGTHQEIGTNYLGWTLMNVREKLGSVPAPDRYRITHPVLPPPEQLTL